MKATLVFLFSLLFYFQVAGQDVNLLIKEGDRLEAAPNEKAALAKYKEALKLQPVNLYALNKCSELCSRIGKRQADKKMVEDYYTAAKTYAETALRINPNNAESNCVMAIALGRSSLNKSGHEKINSAKEIKKYVDASIKNDPKNFKAWHVLGRWNYEISTLNIFERAAVKLLFGGLPSASISQAIFAFERSKAISNGFILNYYEMAKAYRENDQTDKAIAAINIMLLLPNQTEDDPVIKESGRRLLKELR